MELLGLEDPLRSFSAAIPRALHNFSLRPAEPKLRTGSCSAAYPFSLSGIRRGRAGRWPSTPLRRTCPAYLRSDITDWYLTASSTLEAVLSANYESACTEDPSRASQATLPDPSVLYVR